MSSDERPAPGSLTVPLLDGWVGIVVVLLVVVVVGVAFLLMGAVTTGRRGSPEWQAWLDGRSRGRSEARDLPPVPDSPGGRPPSGETADPLRTRVRR